MVSQRLHAWPADKWNLAKDANGQLVQDYMEASGQHQHTTSLKHGCRRQLSEKSAASATMKVVPNVVSAGASRALVAVHLKTAPSPEACGMQILGRAASSQAAVSGLGCRAGRAGSV